MLSPFLVMRFGRKKNVILSMLSAGVSCGVIAVIAGGSGLETARTVLGVVGISFMTVSVTGVNVWSIELFPTHIRATAMGFFEFSGHIGGALSPWIAKGLLAVSKEAPFIVMGSLSIVASVALFVLPETRGEMSKECTTKVECTAISNGVVTKGDLKNAPFEI